MNIEIEKYVEEYWFTNYLDGYVKKIDSREEYINQIGGKQSLILIRFFDRQVISINNDKYYSKPINYSSFIAVNDLTNVLGYSKQELKNSVTDVYDTQYRKEVTIDKILTLSDYKTVLLGSPKVLKNKNKW